MKKKIFISLFTFIILGLFIFAYAVIKTNSNKYTPQTNLSAPIEIPSQYVKPIEEINSSDKPALVMFYVDWCTYCRRFMPIFGKLAQEYKDTYTFAVLNCDYPENKKYLKEFHIIGFPSIFVVDKKYNHKFAVNMAGTTDTSIMKEELNNYLNFRKNFLTK